MERNEIGNEVNLIINQRSRPCTDKRKQLFVFRGKAEKIRLIESIIFSKLKLCILLNIIYIFTKNLQRFLCHKNRYAKYYSCTSTHLYIYLVPYTSETQSSFLNVFVSNIYQHWIFLSFDIVKKLWWSFSVIILINIVLHFYTFLLWFSDRF